MKVIFVLTAFLIFQNSAVFGAGCPSNFPRGITCNITDFENWSHDYKYNCLYTAWPTTEDQVLTLANWAFNNSYTMRASGMMHGYSPLTVEDNPQSVECVPIISYIFPICRCPQPPKILLVKTLQLTQMKVISNTPGNSSFWTQPGITLSTVLENLEKAGLGILNVPSIGSITIGGAFTIGGHGTGVRTKNSNPPLDPGHTYGSISNLIMEVRVVAYDGSKYILKTIPRTDPAMQGILVNLGRTLITNYTVRAGPLKNMSCRSYLNISATELFAHPDDTNAKKTISYYLDTTGIVETILFTFTDYPWTKVWEIAPTQPVGSRLVTTTNNYPFVDNFLDPISNIIQAASNIPLEALTAIVSGDAEYTATVTALYNPLLPSYYLWGTSRTVLLYVNNPLRWTEDGNGILTKRENVQLVVNTVYVIYQRILTEYPIFGPFQIRVTGVDNPADVLIPGAQVAGMGPASPSTQNPEFDTVVWVNFLTFVKTQTYISFMAAMEGELIAKFKPPLALLRTEWSKAWGFNTETNQAAANASVIKNVLLPNQRDFAAAKTALNNMDPPFLFSDPALNLVFK